MASTTLLSTIDRSSTYPEVVAVSSDNNKGYLSVNVDTSWTDQMYSELPSIKFNIYTELNSENVKFEPFCLVVSTGRKVNDINIPAQWCESIYNIPETFYMSIEPLFDKMAIKAHNEVVENGISDDPLWINETATFPIDIKFITD